MSIIRKSIQETTGNSNNVAQSFRQNIFFDAREVATLPFIFELPRYTTTGGSNNYYDQDPRAIFTNLVKPFIRYDFSANTASFGPTTKIKHDIYRVSWDVFSAYQEKVKLGDQKQIETDDVTSETIEELDTITGAKKVTKITKTTSNRSNTLESTKDWNKNVKTGALKNILSESGSELNNSATVRQKLLGLIQQQLDEPIVSITASTTGITTNIYDFQIEQYTKNLGQYKTELFQDRDQYIIDTKFIFERDVTAGLKDLLVLDEDGAIMTGTYETVITGETISNRESVLYGEYAGLEFWGGEYFSYFQVPDKPTLEYPTPEGQISTFTPEIFWTNGEGADEYLVQVTYNTGDTGFTGTVFSYAVPKSDDYKENATSKTKASTTEFTTSKVIRKFQMSLKSNSCLLYRVGNVKVLNNLFGVKQSVVTFSDNKQICTQAEPIKTYVFVENDSPYVETIAGLSTPPSLLYESPLGEYVLSGTVSGSTVTGATMQLIYPNSSFVTTPTDSGGTFSIGGLEAGTYTLNTTYRGYAVDSRSIIITGDTSISIGLQIRWDNIYDLVAIKENDIIKY